MSVAVELMLLSTEFWKNTEAEHWLKISDVLYCTPSSVTVLTVHSQSFEG